MCKKFKYTFNEEHGVLYKYYYGNITIEDIRSSWKYAFDKHLIPKEIKGFILDFRNAQFDMEIKEYIQIVQFYSKNLDFFGDYKFAIITENPRDIVIPILVSTKDKGYSSRPFSSTQAALDWILN